MKAGLFALTVVLATSGFAYATMPEITADVSAGENIIRVTSQNDARVTQNGMLAPAETMSGTPSPSFTPKSDSIPYMMQQRMRQEQGKPVATQAWTRAASIGQAVAVYFSLRGGLETDVLKSVSTPWAQKAEIHQTRIDEQGVARMSRVDNLDVASEAMIEFSPQGLHIMLTGLKRELRPQQFFPVLLNFEKAGIVRFMVSVRMPDGAVGVAPMVMEAPSSPASSVGVARGQAAPHHAPTPTSPTSDSQAAPSSDMNTMPH